MKILKRSIFWIFVLVCCIATTRPVKAQTVDELIERFKSGNREVRNKARDDLVKLGALAVEPLISALTDENEDVRKDAAYALWEIGDIGDKRAVEPLIAALKDSGKWVRVYAIYALEEIGDTKAVEPLVTVLEDEQAENTMRHSAASALGEIGDKRAVEPLIAALKDRDSYVRVCAASALGKFGDPRALEALIGLLDDYSERTRKRAAAALGKIADERAVQGLIIALNNEDDDVREIAADALIKKGDKKVIEPVIVLLTYKDRDVRAAAAKVLGKIPDPRAVRPLLLAIKREKERSVRTYVGERISEALVNIGGMAVAPLIDALKDEDAGIRVQAALFLGKVKDERRVEPLLSALINDESADVRKAAARALIGVRDQRIVQPLIKCMQSEENPDIRRWAAIALGTAKDSGATTVLIEAALHDRDKEVQQASRSALLKIKDPRAVEVYVDLLNSEDSGTRLQAARILLSLKDPEAEKVHAQALRVVQDESYLTELMTYDQYGRPDNIILFDVQGLQVDVRRFQGVPVAKKELTFSQYNSRQITQEKIIVFGIDEVAHVTDYDAYGKPKNVMWLCLDEKGNVIKNADGKAVLVKPFQAEQRSEYEKQYSGAYITSKITKIYPCKNCVEQTGIKNCRYVW